MTVDLSKLRVFNDDELQRLKTDNPRLKDNPDKWCPTCSKENGCTYKHNGKTVECDCLEQVMLYKHYLAAGIGDVYHRLDWKHYTRNELLVAKLSKVIDEHEEYVRRGIGVIFTGPVGSGKTMLTTLTLKEFVKLGYRVYSTSGTETTTMLTAGWRQPDEKRRFEDVFVRSDVLGLDDVGRDILEDDTGEVQQASKFKENVLDTILRRRVQFARPTLINTNLTVDQLEEGYGGAVFSLLTERSMVFEVTGEDFRGNVLRAEVSQIEKGERSPIV